MTYDSWKAHNPQDDELGSCSQGDEDFEGETPEPARTTAQDHRLGWPPAQLLSRIMELERECLAYARQADHYYRELSILQQTNQYLSRRLTELEQKSL